jgi:hypothetical protein
LEAAPQRGFDMRDRRVLILPLLALLAGLAVGYLQGGAHVTASDQSLASLAPAPTSDGSALSVLKGYQLGPAQPIASASGNQQLYTISDASGAVCDVQ